MSDLCTLQWRSYEPERSNPRLNVQATPELEVPLIDVLNELRLVKQECRQLRTQVENVAPVADELHETAVVELVVSRQDSLMARMERLENCLRTVVQDQNNAAETGWNNAQNTSSDFRKDFETYQMLSGIETLRDS